MCSQEQKQKSPERPLGVGSLLVTLLGSLHKSKHPRLALGIFSFASILLGVSVESVGIKESGAEKAEPRRAEFLLPLPQSQNKITVDGAGSTWERRPKLGKSVTPCSEVPEVASLRDWTR